jgi:hypothetical protein
VLPVIVHPVQLDASRCSTAAISAASSPHQSAVAYFGSGGNVAQLPLPCP